MTTPRTVIMNEIMTLPASVVITAAAQIKGLTSTDKAECAAALSGLVESGHTSLAEIRGVVPVKKVISRDTPTNFDEGRFNNLAKQVDTHIDRIMKIDSAMDTLHRAIDSVKSDSNRGFKAALYPGPSSPRGLPLPCGEQQQSGPAEGAAPRRHGHRHGPAVPRQCEPEKEMRH
jgi:hypothetical protein